MVLNPKTFLCRNIIVQLPYYYQFTNNDIVV